MRAFCIHNRTKNRLTAIFLWRRERESHSPSTLLRVSIGASAPLVGFRQAQACHPQDVRGTLPLTIPLFESLSFHQPYKKYAGTSQHIFYGGERGIRTLAGCYTPTALAKPPLQPLGYLSNKLSKPTKYNIFYQVQKNTQTCNIYQIQQFDECKII